MRFPFLAAICLSVVAFSGIPAVAQHRPPDVYKVVPPKLPQKEIPLIVDPEAEVVATPQATFITGGIGEDERLTIEAAKANYNVHVSSAKVNGEFVDEAQVVIRKGSEEVLSTQIGPLLYVQLPPGKYELEATYKGEKKLYHFSISLKKKTATVRLAWKPEAAE